MWVITASENQDVVTHISAEQKPSEDNQIFHSVRGHNASFKERMGSETMSKSVINQVAVLTV